jgi:predicted permease
MPVIANVLSIVFPVFCIIALGYLFASFKKISLEPIIEVLLYLTIPALVISSLAQKRFSPGEVTLISMAVVGVVLGTGLFSYIYLSFVNRTELRGFYLTTMFMNSGNMGFPLALLAFGTDGLAVSVVYFIAVGLLVYTLGIYIAKGKGGFTEIFKLPLIYAAVIGLTMNLGGYTLPAPVLTTLEMLGAATIPLMQISLGYRLYSASISMLKTSIAGSVIRIGGGVAVAYVMVSLLGIQGLERKIIILSSAMPSAVITFVMSYKYRLQSELVASIVATSTFISVVTTPLVLMWLL